VIERNPCATNEEWVFNIHKGEVAMAVQSATTALSVHHKPFFKSLYFQVLTAIVLGVLLGHYYPQLGEQMKPLGDGFIKMIKMIIAPIGIVTLRNSGRSKTVHSARLKPRR
jgi:Na+/serine symporter